MELKCAQRERVSPAADLELIAYFPKRFLIMNLINDWFFFHFSHVHSKFFVPFSFAGAFDSCLINQKILQMYGLLTRYLSPTSASASPVLHSPRFNF